MRTVSQEPERTQANLKSPTFEIGLIPERKSYARGTNNQEKPEIFVPAAVL
jgi:hypothetical protein